MAEVVMAVVGWVVAGSAAAATAVARAAEGSEAVVRVGAETAAAAREEATAAVAATVVAARAEAARVVVVGCERAAAAPGKSELLWALRPFHFLSRTATTNACYLGWSSKPLAISIFFGT